MDKFHFIYKGSIDAKTSTVYEKEDEALYSFSFRWEDAEEIIIEWYTPICDISGRFHPDCRHDRSLPAEWMSWQSTMTSYSMPLHVYYNDCGETRYGFAFSETSKELIVNSGVHEEDGTLRHRIYISLAQFGNRKEFTASLLEITKKEPFEDTVRHLSGWLSEGISPADVPLSAKQPMYSTWYSFHQNMTAEEIEKECAAAKELGFSTIIVDDGWQTEDNNRGYAFCGEYEVAKTKFPNMKEHVRRVHQMGMKYMVWLSVPYLGKKSKIWEAFSDKLLRFEEGSGAGILDPRYKEVREHLIALYKKTLTDYDLDGLKLDFIDLFRYSGIDANERMDIPTVQEAVVRLMSDIRKELSAIKPDVMIEFRQRYIGPHMRAFGNMFRVNDCPNDYLTNRICSVDLRLTSGNTAVHSDMLMWHKDETPETAARQILNVLFSVLQFSVKLDSLTPENKKMVRFWVNFMKEHAETLLDAPIYGECPHLLYPLVRAASENEEIIALYEKNYLVNLSKDTPKHYIVNATHADAIFVEVCCDKEVTVSVYDTYGARQKEEKTMLSKGVNRISVPESGLVVIE